MKITDLSRAELAEWIADWFIYDTRRGVGLDGLVYEIGEGVHGGHWFGIRNELLDAYAATTQPPPPGQERAEGEGEPTPNCPKCEGRLCMDHGCKEPVPPEPECRVCQGVGQIGVYVSPGILPRNSDGFLGYKPCPSPGCPFREGN